MVNRAKKGYTKEKRARDELKADGWRIVFKSVRYRFGTIDFATLFDIVAYKGKERMFISCKHFGNSNNYLPHQEEIKKFKEEFGYLNEIYTLWNWHHPRNEGRGDKKKWVEGHWDKIVL